MLGGGPWLLPSPCTPSFERLSSRGEIPVEHFQREPATEQQRKAEVLQPCPRPHVLPLLLLRRQPDHSCQDFRLRSQLAAAGGGWCRACETPSEVPKLADPDGQGQQPANDGRDGRRLSVQGRWGTVNGALGPGLPRNRSGHGQGAGWAVVAARAQCRVDRGRLRPHLPWHVPARLAG